MPTPSLVRTCEWAAKSGLEDRQTFQHRLALAPARAGQRTAQGTFALARQLLLDPFARHAVITLAATYLLIRPEQRTPSRQSQLSRTGIHGGPVRVRRKITLQVFTGLRGTVGV